MYAIQTHPREQTIVEIVNNMECGPVKLSAIAGGGNVGVYATMEGVHGDLEEILYPEDFKSEGEVLKAVYDLAFSALAGCFCHKNEERL